MMGAGGPSPEFIKLLKSWGIEFDPTKVAGDIANARRVQFGGGVRPVVTEYVGWLGLDRSSLDEKDVLSGGVERLNLGIAGLPHQGRGRHHASDADPGDQPAGDADRGGEVRRHARSSCPPARLQARG